MFTSGNGVGLRLGPVKLRTGWTSSSVPIGVGGAELGGTVGGPGTDTSAIAVGVTATAAQARPAAAKILARRKLETLR